MFEKIGNVENNENVQKHVEKRKVEKQNIEKVENRKH